MGFLRKMFGLGEGGLTPEQFAARPIRLTKEAAEFVRETVKREKMHEQTAIKISVQIKPFRYDLELIAPPAEGQYPYRSQSQGFLIVVPDGRNASWLAGTEIGLRVAPEGKGFVFDNPNLERMKRS